MGIEPQPSLKENGQTGSREGRSVGLFIVCFTLVAVIGMMEAEAVVCNVVEVKKQGQSSIIISGEF